MKNKRLKIRKRREQATKPADYPVLICSPVPIMDGKLQSGLSGFIAGAVYNKMGLPYSIDSRDPENGRNAMIEDFLTKPEFQRHSHILFVDADTVPINPFAIQEMLKLDKPVVSGVTPIAFSANKQNELGMYWNVKIDAKEKRNLFLHELPLKPFTAARVGCSCMLVRRDVFGKLTKPYQKPTYNEEYTGFVKGEDHYFCENIIKAGYEIWIHPEIQCHHYHTMDMMDILLMLARYAQQTESQCKELKYMLKVVFDKTNALNNTEVSKLFTETPEHISKDVIEQIIVEAVKAEAA